MESAAELIVPVEDAESTADAVIRLARDHTLRRRLGDAARERARVFMKLIQQSRFGFACCAAVSRCALYLSSQLLGPGNARTRCSLLANYWIGRHHDVTITTFELPNATHFFPLENGVSVRELGAPPVYGQLMARLVAIALRVSRLRSLLQRTVAARHRG